VDKKRRMKSTVTMKTNRPSTRSGFTIIELLIVILLMSIMLSILVSLVRGVMGTTRYAATKTTIIKISRILEDRTEAFRRYMDKLDKRAGNSLPRYVKPFHLKQAGGRRQLALILARKDEFRRHFPQMFSEINTSTSNNNWPTLNPDGSTNSNYDPLMHELFPESESSECLYFFLTQGDTFGAEQIAADAFTSLEVMDTDGDGLQEFVDSWGKPLRFYRWPTRLVRPNPTLDPDNDNWTQGGTWQEIRDDSIDIFDREFRFKVDERAAKVVMGPLPPRPRFNDPDLTSRLPLLKDDGSFYSTPTIKTELEDPLARDGDDPLGLTFRSFNTQQLPKFDRPMSPANFEKLYHTASTYNVPLIISAGPDGILGLYEPFPTEDLNKDGTLDPNEDRNENGEIDRTFGHLAQPIIDSNSIDLVDESLFDDISNLFLRSGVAR
jgi:prepilin-type N-terminal cleavage/methylation domain-containing protein